MTSTSPRTLSCLAALFVLALVPRLYSALALGWDWDQPGSFTLVNFDEAGSCRAALDGFGYTPFLGYQTIAVASALGNAPPQGIRGEPRAVKAYCHSAGHILVARSMSAVAGALTVPLIAWIGFTLLPATPGIGLAAAALLALSGFHISESQSGTVDAPAVLFIYLFLAVTVWAVSRGSRWAQVLSPLLLVPAVWAKYWVFAPLALLAWVPGRVWQYITHGMTAARVVVVLLAGAMVCGLLSIRDFHQPVLYPLLALFYLVIPWRRVHRPMAAVWALVPLLAWAVFQVDVVREFTVSGSSGRFGSAYGAINWHKWPRNLTNLPLVLLVGLGLPACLFLPTGVKSVLRHSRGNPAWLCLVPLLVFALYMAFATPITYYRHYLALLPAAALVAACGLYATRWHRVRWFMALFFLWPALLALDLVSDYHMDPRIELRQWYREHPGAKVFASYYVSPPPGTNSALFTPEYAFGDAAVLRRADYLVLSENWYENNFANELNGPLAQRPERLIKTKPEYVAFYRQALAGQHPYLREEGRIEVRDFMPELLLHRMLYGTFQVFVGDLVIFRVLAPPPGPAPR